jgi:uncharacterized protein YciW
MKRVEHVDRLRTVGQEAPDAVTISQTAVIEYSDRGSSVILL